MGGLAGRNEDVYLMEAAGDMWELEVPHGFDYLSNSLADSFISTNCIQNSPSSSKFIKIVPYAPNLA